jgi:2-polyprenyl-3-methyl-5-hydroxy-6-metoxy-1,4-benzoquinol methylase
MAQSVRQTHLEFYREHQITPVRYDLSDMDAHLERRYSLYTKLGLLPLAFKGANVLEIAAGTGHNSLYVANQMPSAFTLLEPNEVAIEYIQKAYASFTKPHTTPKVICSKVEDYSPESKFDIVLCENWLGTSRHELSLMQKISEFVSFNGVLVVTTISPVGFVPNVLRRLISAYLSPVNQSFAERTEALTAAFGSHLETMVAMTRSHVDWVQDNMINPAYFGLCLSIPFLLEKLGDRFEAVQTFPVIAEDWRWFKGLYGSERKFNEHFLTEYWKKSHNFLDYREPAMPGKVEVNAMLEKKAVQLLEAVASHEDIHVNNADTSASIKEILTILDDFITLLPSHLDSAIRGLSEARNLISNPRLISIESVKNMSDFCGLFGRETVYVSLTRV